MNVTTRSADRGRSPRPELVGLGKAAELALECMDEENTRLQSLRDRLEKGLLERIPNIFVTGDPLARLPNIANVAFDSIDCEATHFSSTAAASPAPRAPPEPLAPWGGAMF